MMIVTCVHVQVKKKESDDPTASEDPKGKCPYTPVNDAHESAGQCCAFGQGNIFTPQYDFNWSYNENIVNAQHAFFLFPLRAGE